MPRALWIHPETTLQHVETTGVDFTQTVTTLHHYLD